MSESTELASRVMQMVFVAAVLALVLTMTWGYPPAASSTSRSLIEVGWVMLALSCVAGLIAMLSLTGASTQKQQPADVLFMAQIRWPWMLQIVGFFAAVVLLIVQRSLVD